MRTPHALLGSVPADRGVAIMVTMPSEAAVDYSLVQHLAEHGMDCMRINCAHDDEAAWARMIEHLRRAELATGRACRVLMDLAGPKLRTGPLEPGPCVVKVGPTRDVFGRRNERDRLHIRITNTRVRGAKLAADKGINLPDSALRLAAMTDKDRADLAFVGVHADMVALSFVNTVDDVRALRTLWLHLAIGNPQSSSR